MAQKAAKTIAASNATRLKQARISLGMTQVLFVLLRFVLRSGWRKNLHSTTTLWGNLRSILIPWVVLTAPALGLHVWIERIGKPKFDAQQRLIRSGQDLSANGGVMEWIWDVIYWTHLCTVIVAVMGREKVWFLWVVIPIYTVYLAYSKVREAQKFITGKFGTLGNGKDGVTNQNKPDQAMKTPNGKHTSKQTTNSTRL